MAHPDDLDHKTANPADLQAIARLAHSTRPDWPEAAILTVLQSHAAQVHLADLTVAAMRAAQRPEFRTPRAIGWRGPHWDGAKTMPLEVAAKDRCDTCGKTEPRCLTERPGQDDDHVFVARRRIA